MVKNPDDFPVPDSGVSEDDTENTTEDHIENDSTDEEVAESTLEQDNEGLPVHSEEHAVSDEKKESSQEYPEHDDSSYQVSEGILDPDSVEFQSMSEGHQAAFNTILSNVHDISTGEALSQEEALNRDNRGVVEGETVPEVNLSEEGEDGELMSENEMLAPETEAEQTATDHSIKTEESQTVTAETNKEAVSKTPEQTAPSVSQLVEEESIPETEEAPSVQPSVSELVDEEVVPETEEMPTIAETLGEDAVATVREEMKVHARDLPAETADEKHQNYESARQEVLEEYEKVFNDKYHIKPEENELELATEETIRTENKDGVDAAPSESKKGEGQKTEVDPVMKANTGNEEAVRRLDELKDKEGVELELEQEKTEEKAGAPEEENIPTLEVDPELQKEIQEKTEEPPKAALEKSFLELDYQKELSKLEKLAPELDPKELKQEIDRLDSVSKDMLATLQNENREFTPEEQKEDWAISDTKNYLKKIESYSILLQGANRGKERGEELDDNQWKLIRGKNGVSRLADGIIADGSLDEINTIISKVEDPKIVSVLEAARNTSIALVKERSPEQFEEIFGEKNESGEVSPMHDDEKYQVEEGGEHVVLETKEESLQEKLQDNISAKAFEEFGISKEGLESIPGYNELHHEQQLLVAENLKQLAFGHMEEVRAQKFEEELQGKGSIRKIWHAIRRGSHMKRIGKEVYAESMDAGLDFHGEDLQSLIESAKEGPGAKVLEDGSLQIQYATGFENLTPEQSESVEKFNVVANEFARVPLEWKYAKEGSKERKAYEEKSKEFENAKDFVQELKESSENREAAIMLEARMSEGVEMNQFFNANPEVEERLATLKNGESFGAAFMRNAKEKGVYMAAGGVTRHALTAVLGGMAFPAAIATGGIIGYFRGRKEGYQDIDERNFKARYGEKYKDMEERNVNDIVQSTNRLEHIIEQIETTEDIVERAALVGRLERRIDINALKDSEGKLNFGGRGENVGNVSRFINKMGEARALIEMGPPPAEFDETSEKTEIVGNIDTSNLPKYFEKTEWDTWKETQKESLINSGASDEDAERMVTDIMVKSKETQKSKRASERLGKILEFHDEEIAQADKRHVKKKTWEGTKKGLKYAAVGALIADYITDGPVSTKVEEVAGDIKESIVGGESHYGDLIESLNTEEGVVVAEAGAVAATESAPALSFEHEVQAGDNLWNIITEKLDTGMYTEGMDEVHRTHLIDAVKDKFAGMTNEELSEMGFTHIGADGRIDINILDAGDKLDLSRVFSDTESMTESLKETVMLSEEAQASIAENLQNTQEAVTENVSNTASEVATSETTNAAAQSAEVTEPGGGNGGGGGEVFSSEATAMPENDDGIEFETSEEPEGQISENAENIKPFMTEHEKTNWVAERKAGYLAKYRHLPEHMANNTAKKLADRDWIYFRNEQLAKELGADPKNFDMSEMRGTLNGKPIPKELIQKYDLQPIKQSVFDTQPTASETAPETTQQSNRWTEQSPSYADPEDFDAGTPEASTHTDYPSPNDDKAWEELIQKQTEQYMIEHNASEENARKAAENILSQKRTELSTETISKLDQQNEPPNYTGEKIDFSHELTSREIAPHEYKELETQWGSTINEELEKIFIDENTQVTRGAQRVSRNAGVFRQLGANLSKKVNQEAPILRGAFDTYRKGIELDASLGGKAAEMSGFGKIDNMDQWSSLKTLSVEEFNNLKSSLAKTGDAIERKNIGQLDALLRKFTRAGIKTIPSEPLHGYILRGTAVLKGVPS